MASSYRVSLGPQLPAGREKVQLPGWPAPRVRTMLLHPALSPAHCREHHTDTGNPAIPAQLPTCPNTQHTYYTNHHPHVPITTTHTHTHTLAFSHILHPRSEEQSQITCCTHALNCGPFHPYSQGCTYPRTNPPDPPHSSRPF
jgi:hypothetical protein